MFDSFIDHLFMLESGHQCDHNISQSFTIVNRIGIFETAILTPIVQCEYNKLQFREYTKLVLNLFLPFFYLPDPNIKEGFLW